MYIIFVPHILYIILGENYARPRVCVMANGTYYYYSVKAFRFVIIIVKKNIINRKEKIFARLTYIGNIFGT